MVQPFQRQHVRSNKLQRHEVHNTQGGKDEEGCERLPQLPVHRRCTLQLQHCWEVVLVGTLAPERRTCHGVEQHTVAQAQQLYAVIVEQEVGRAL